MNHSTVAISNTENICIINVLRHHVQQRNTCSNQLVSWNGEVCILMMDTVYFNKLLIRTGDLHRSGICTRQVRAASTPLLPWKQPTTKQLSGLWNQHVDRQPSTAVYLSEIMHTQLRRSGQWGRRRREKEKKDAENGMKRKKIRKREGKEK